MLIDKIQQLKAKKKTLEEIETLLKVDMIKHVNAQKALCFVLLAS